jgi:tetratricopeptide (TPR) repeat protein
MPGNTCAIAGAIVLSALAGTAFAGPAKQTQAWIWCLSKERASLDLQITGCTTVIASGKKKTHLGRIFDNRGVAYYRKGQYDHAIEDYDQAVQLGYSNALYNRSLAKEKLGDKAGADADLEAFRRVSSKVGR